MYHNLKTDAFVNYLGMCMLQTCIKPWKNSFRKFSPEHRDRCGRVVLWKSSCKTQEGGGLKMLQFLIQKLRFPEWISRLWSWNTRSHTLLVALQYLQNILFCWPSYSKLPRFLDHKRWNSPSVFLAVIFLTAFHVSISRPFL